MIDVVKVHIEDLKTATHDLQKSVDQLSLITHTLPSRIAEEYEKVSNRQWKELERMFYNLDQTMNNSRETHGKKIELMTTELKTAINTIYSDKEKWLEILKIASMIFMSLAALFSAIVAIIKF